MNRKLLLSFVLFFTYLINYGQCSVYPSSGTSQIGGDQFFCIDGTNPITIGSMAARNYVVVNVIKGYNYTFSIPNITWAGAGSTIKYLGLFDDAPGNAFLTQNNSTGAVSLTWTATLSGKIRVLLLRNNNCSAETSTTTTTLSMNLNTVANNSTIDSQTAYGVGSWKGHIYNWTGTAPPGGNPSPTNLSETTYPFITGSPANYAGYYNVGSDVIPVGFNFGGGDDTTCFDVYSEGSVRGSIDTHNFAIRYRMTWNKAPGCYFVKVTGDDGVRLYVDGKLVFDRWVQQSPTYYDYILVNLAANSNLVLDYYENTGNNQVSFQIVPFDATANTITAPTTTNLCSGGDPALIEGSFKYNDNGTEMQNPYINYQWRVSTNGAAYVNVPSNGNSRTYDPPVITAAGTNTITKYKRIATINATNAPGVTCTFNESNEVTIITSPGAPARPAAGTIRGTATQCPSVNNQIYTVDAVANTVRYDWTVPTGWSIISGAGTNSITVTTGTVGQNGNIGVQTWNGCGFNANGPRTFAVTVGTGSIGGSVSGSSSVCAGTNNTVFNLTGNTGNVIRWESSTDNFASVITPITNTTTTLTATNVSVTTSYRAVVQNGSCPAATSAVGTVSIKNPIATGVTICQGGSGSLTTSSTCAAIAQTPMTASGSGGTSRTLNYGEAGNTDIVINFPSLPAGAVVTSTNAIITYTAKGNSYLRELRVRIEPPVAMGAAIDDISPSSGTTGTATNAPLASWANTNPTGNWVFKFKETYVDNADPDANISNITITVNYTLPSTIDWYTVASGGTKVGSGASFDPVAAGLVNANTVGTTPFYAVCSSDPAACRTMVNFVINEVPTTPVLGTFTQPTCVVTFGTIALSGLPSGGTLTRSPGAVVVPYSGTTVIDSNLAGGTYSYTVGNGNCTSAATTGVVINPPPAIATYNGTWDNAPSVEKKLIFASNFTSTGDVTGCSCEVNSGANVTIGVGHTLNITNDVKVLSGGTMTFKNTASLVQINNVTNTGDITYERTTPPILLKDYVYWSTPVSPQTLVNLSSLTPSTMYYGFDGTQWVRAPRTDNMVVGKGYIIRAPSNYSNSSKTAYPASFKGVPNNGNIETEMLASGKSYLIGNPYPSALSGERFVSEGIEGFIKTNENVINGTLYFWTHNTPAKPVASNQYTTDDYASFNLLGSTKANSGGDKPTGEIAAGQSFFLTTKAAGKILFTNAMRLGAVDNGQFFRPANTSRKSTIERHRIWLNLISTTGAFKQLLLGYAEGASNDYETLYDGLTLDGNQYLDFYTISDTKKFVIQGRALPFTDSDVVPLGYRTAVAGDFTISIDEADGKLAKQAIYVEDKTTGVIHDLTQSNYTFKTEVGNFTERLVLRYTGKTLGVGDFENVKDGILVSIKNKVIAIQSSQENIKEVTVYDVSGKILYNKKKVSNTELQIQNLPSSNQVLLVKVTLANDFTATRKIIFQ
ncbi:T9SS sorting signal type C domain-containing protein [Flavobacterium collinsii]|uniref:PA14 domain-containing protein n=1 Tax=Flavobacterium collinsii TaxID=1114861 RepID=A0A9W4TD86_9FLAO|nr:T9SS sorting signal type C domain-containing protein [Flavobacterium collinsii]CAI2765829.1 PA14 domain-containing protein [Flavobacterium collinsii]